MNTLIPTIKNRKKELAHIIDRADKLLKDAPTGLIRVSKSNNSYQYYLSDSPLDRHGRYIKKADRAIAERIINADYAKKVKEVAENELRDLEVFLNKYENNTPEDVFLKECKARQLLIKPLAMTNETFLSNWINQRYESNPYNPEECIYETKQGEMVRSKSEQMIADMYYDLSVPYRYESPVELGYGRIKYPDFTILDVKNQKEIYHEHLGLLDNDVYREKNLKKINEYQRAGVFQGKNLIITHEANGSPFNVRDLEKMIIELLAL